MMGLNHPQINLDIVEEPKIVFVDSVKLMLEMCSHLEEQKEIGLDSEFDTQMFYHDCIALIQISSFKFNFLIDPFTMFPYIQKMIGPIFMNPNIVKIVWSENDIRFFARDFQIYFVGVIDLQNLRKIALGLENNESLSKVA